MNIAITFRDDQSLTQSWFGSGIAQNLKFYYDLFELMGHSVSFLVNKKVTIEDRGKRYNETTRLDAIESGERIDIIIEAGVTVNDAEQALFREKCGSKIIGLRCGNQYYTAVEGLLTAKDLPPNLFTTGHDALWILPHHGQQKEWLSILHNCPVDVVPYIWEPDFVAPDACAGEADVPPNVVIMEPNISIAKSAFVQLVALQRVFDRNAELFNQAFIYNADQFASAENFLYNFVDKLSVLQAHNEKAYFQPRMAFNDIFRKPHVLFGHQFHNELNNLYKEAIYLGIPFVHNSPPYKKLGYYYEDLRAIQAAEMLEQALTSHNRESAIEQGREFLKGYSISDTKVQSTYEKLLNI